MAWEKRLGQYEHAVKRDASRGIPEEFRDILPGYKTLCATYEALSCGDRGVIRIYALSDDSSHAACLAEMTFGEPSAELEGIARRVVQSDEFVHHIMMSLNAPDTSPIAPLRFRFVSDD